MNALEARAYLKHLRKWLSEDDDGNPTDYYKKFLDALDVALDAVAPPVGAGRCEWVFLPDKDMTPYEHISITTRLMDILAPGAGPSENELTPEDGHCIFMALMVYKTVLMKQHKNRLRDELREAVDHDE